MGLFYWENTGHSGTMFSFIWKALAVAQLMAARQHAGPHGAMPRDTWSSRRGVCQSLGQLSNRAGEGGNSHLIPPSLPPLLCQSCDLLA